MSRASLARLLVGDAPTQAAIDAIDACLAAAIADAQRRWPGVTVDDRTYVAWIAERIPADASDLVRALEGLRLVDLYFACACAAGAPKALEAFDVAFLASKRFSDDVKQMLRQKLFVRDKGDVGIARYAGRGSLGGWVRAVAVRISIDLERATREIPMEDALLSAIGLETVDGPDGAVARRDAKSILQAALREAFASLSARHRTLLLQYYLDGLDLAALGKLFDLAPSNVSRTIAKARVLLLSQIRRSLLRDKQIHKEELDSLVALVQSQLSLPGPIRR